MRLTLLPKTSGIYSIYSEVNDRSYIGSAKNLWSRGYDHQKKLRKGDHDNIHLQRAWNKYGEDAFEFVVLEECEIERLIEREQYWIDSTLSRYNIALVAGSWFGNKHSPETRAKMSADRKGRKPTDEARANMSAAGKGRVFSAEHRANLSAAMAGRKRSPETRAKLSEIARKRTHSPGSNAKRSATMKAHWEQKNVETQ